MSIANEKTYRTGNGVRCANSPGERDTSLVISTNKTLHDDTTGVTSYHRNTTRDNGITHNRSVVKALRNADERKLADRVELCSATHSGERRKSFCKVHRVCFWCSLRYTMELLSQHVPPLQDSLTRNPAWIASLLTLTVKNGPNLRKRFAHLSKSLTSCSTRRRNALQGRGRPSVFQHVITATWQIELPRGKGSKLWHPHVHGLVIHQHSIGISELAVDGGQKT